jgi:predicted dinucleotide-utilizing enzyme
MPESTDQPMMALVDAAFRRASQDVVELALRSGTPVIVWNDGAVVAMDPRQVLNELPPKQQETLFVDGNPTRSKTPSTVSPSAGTTD